MHFFHHILSKSIVYAGLMTSVMVANLAAAESVNKAAKSSQPKPSKEAAPGCSIDLTSLKPLLPDTSSIFKDKVTRRKDKEALVELVALNTGMGLAVTQGGCEHYGVSYDFSGVADTASVSNRRHYIKVAIDLLQTKVGEKSIASDLAKVISDGMAQIPKTSAPEDKKFQNQWGHCAENECTSVFSCGDWTCTVNVKRIDSSKVLLSAAYFYPL